MMTQNARNSFGLALTAVVIGATLTACGSTSAGSAAPASGSTVAGAPSGGASSPAAVDTGSATGSGSGGTVPSVPPVPGSSPKGQVAPVAAACIGPQLAVSAGRSDGAAGHIGARMIFKNTSGKACTLYGFPGLAGLDASGKQQVQAQRVTSGYLGSAKETTVLVAPGGTASALVGGVDVPSGNATSCPTYPKLLVTPPGTRASSTIALSMPGCPTLDVYPVVAGVPSP